MNNGWWRARHKVRGREIEITIFVTQGRVCAEKIVDTQTGNRIYIGSVNVGEPPDSGFDWNPLRPPMH